MLRKLLTVSLILGVSVLTQFSCQRENQGLVSPEQRVVQDISIEEAKAFLTHSRASARIDGQAKTKRDEYWSLAQKLTYKNGLPVVVVPLTYNYSVPLVINGKLPDNGKHFDKSDYAIQKKLFVYKDPKGNVQVDVVSIIPTEDGRKKHKKVQGDDFDGYVLAYDNTETVFRGGWFYKNGKATNRVRIQSTRNARTTALTLNDGGPCDILVFTPSDGSGGSAAYQGGSAARPSTSFTDDAGAMWTLAYTITMSCGGAGADNGGATGPTTNDPSFGDGNWLWNLPPPSSGGGGGYGVGGPPPPYEPFMITENGVTGGSPAENFFYDMEYNHAPSIYFNDAEKQLINDFPPLLYRVKNEIEFTSQKPDLSDLILGQPTPLADLERAINRLINSYSPSPNGRLNVTERQLLGEGTPAYGTNLRKFYGDARSATAMAIIYHGWDNALHQGTSIGNTHKHALLAAIHAGTFTRLFGIILADAHERTPDGQPLQDLPSGMDKWNNAAGIAVFDRMPPSTFLWALSSAIEDDLRAGLMRYRYLGNNYLSPTY